MLDVDGFQTCFGSAASAFEIIELANIHCALKENFSVESERIVYTAVHVSLEKEIENLCTVFTYSIKQARQIRKFYSHRSIQKD